MKVKSLSRKNRMSHNPFRTLVNSAFYYREVTNMHGFKEKILSLKPNSSNYWNKKGK